MAYGKALTLVLLILLLERGGRSPKEEMLTCVCFLQYESAMERMQKSKLSHYKKTMEVSMGGLGRFPCKLAPVKSVSHVPLFKERSKLCECARVCEGGKMSFLL